MYRGSTTGRARENEFSIVRPVRQSKEPTSSSSSSGELINGKRPFQPSRRMPLSTTSTSRPSPPIASRPSPPIASRPSLPIASRPSRSLPSTSDLSRPIPSKTVERALLANPTHPARGSRDPIGVCAEEDPRGARREQFALEQSVESGKMLLEAVKHDKRRLQEDLAVVRTRHSSDAEKWAGEMKDMESLVAQLKANKYCGASTLGESVQDLHKELWEKEALVKEAQLTLAKVKSDAAFARAHHVSNEALVSELLQQKLELTEELAEMGARPMEADQIIQLHSDDGEEFKRQKYEIAALRAELDFHKSQASGAQADLNDAANTQHGWSEYLALRDELKSQKLKLHADETKHDIERQRYHAEVIEMQELLRRHEVDDARKERIDDEEKVECQIAERRLAIAQEELEELQRAMDATQQNVDSYEAQNFVLAGNNAELTNELEEGRVRLELQEKDFEETHSKTKMELQKLKSEKWKAEQKLRDKGREVDDARVEFKVTLAHTVEDIEQQRAKDRKAYDVLRAQRDKHDSEITASRHQVDRLQKKLRIQGEHNADKLAIAERHFNDEITARSSTFHAELTCAKVELERAKVQTQAELGQTLDALVVVEREKDRIAARLKELELAVVSEVMQREAAERQLTSEHANEVTALRTTFEESGKELECRAAEAQEAVEKEYARAHALWQDEVASLTARLDDAIASHANAMLDIECARASTTAQSEDLDAQMCRFEQELATAHANHDVTEAALRAAEHSMTSETQAAHEHAARAHHLELDVQAAGRYASELREANSALQGNMEECEERHRGEMVVLEDRAKEVHAHAARIRILEVGREDHEERAKNVDEHCTYLDARILSQQEFIAQLEEDKTRLHKQLVALEDNKTRLWNEIEQGESERQRDTASYAKHITNLEAVIVARDENRSELVAAAAATLEEEKVKMESRLVTQESLRKSELAATIAMEKRHLSARLNAELHEMLAVEKEHMAVTLAAEKEKLTEDLRAELEWEKEKMDEYVAEEQEKAFFKMNETLAAEKKALENEVTSREEFLRMSAEKQNAIRKECEQLQKRHLEEALADAEEKGRKLNALRVELELKSRAIEQLEQKLDEAKPTQSSTEKKHVDDEEYQGAMKEKNKLKKEKWRLEQKVRSISQSLQDVQEEHNITLASVQEEGEARKKRDLKAIEQLRVSKDDLVNDKSNLKMQMTKLQARIKHVETKFAESEADSQRKLEEQSERSHSELHTWEQKSGKELQMVRDQMLEIHFTAIQEKMELKMEQEAADALKTLEATKQIAEMTERHVAELKTLSHQHDQKYADERGTLYTRWQSEYAGMREELTAEKESLVAVHRSTMEKHTAELEMLKEALESERGRVSSTNLVDEEEDGAAQVPESNATSSRSVTTIPTHGSIGKRIRALLHENRALQENAVKSEQGMQHVREEMHAQQKKSEMVSGELARMKEEKEQYLHNAEQLQEATKNDDKLQRKMAALKAQMKEDTLVLRTETRDKIRLLESDKRRMEQNMGILKAEVDRVEKERNCEVDRLETASSEQQQRHEETDAVRQKKVEVLEKRNAALDDELRNARDYVQRLEFQCDTREHQLAACASVREEHEKQIVVAAAQREEHEKHLAEAATQLQSLLADDLQRTELQQDLSAMSANFDVLHHKYETQSAQLKAAECKVAESADEQAKLETHFASLSRDLRTSGATAERKRMQLEEELENFERQARTKETNMERKLENQEQEASNRIEAAEEKNAQVGRVLGELQEEVELRDKAEKNATTSLRQSQRLHDEYQRRHSATLATLRSELDARKSAYAHLLEEQRQQQNHTSTGAPTAGEKAERKTKKNEKRGGDGEGRKTAASWNNSSPRVESDDPRANTHRVSGTPVQEEENDLGDVNDALSELKHALDTKERELDERRSKVVRSDELPASCDPAEPRATLTATTLEQRPRVFTEEATEESSNSTTQSSDDSVSRRRTMEMSVEEGDLVGDSDLSVDDLLPNVADRENDASFAPLQQQYDARLSSMGSEGINPTMSESDFLASTPSLPPRRSAYPESPRFDAWGAALAEKERKMSIPAAAHEAPRASSPPRVAGMESEDDIAAMFREGERLCCEENAFEQSLVIFDRVLEYFASPSATHVDISHAEVWAHKGVALQSLDRVELAIEAYSAAIDLDPKMHVCLANLATLAAYLRRGEMARQMIADALSLDPGNETYMEIQRALGATMNYYQD
eukprot:GEMP01000232.1.p1 GENE.GEMP01000232.1~~GEMP01000232.1.p1  ORF type:complete len:2221 (+),score=763.52 GEMP01000232.1:99-6761(+)